MSREIAEAVLAYANSQDGKWPLDREAPILTAVNTWAALRDGDYDALKSIRAWDNRRGYRVDPLPGRIADAWAHYLVGDDPRVRAYHDNDGELMEGLLATDFPSELERAVGMMVSEGEIWARAYTDPIVAPRPLLDWVSRTNVLPLWQGIRLVGAAIWTELAPLPSDAKGTIYRHFEVHAPTVVLNALYKGTADKLGDRLPHDYHPATSDLDEVWDHGLPFLLVERIPNRIRRDRRLGVSDYAGILDVLLDLNEAAAIGAANMRLTARQRLVISETLAQAAAGRTAGILDHPDGDLSNGRRSDLPLAKFDPSEEILVEDPLDGELGKNTDPMRVLSYDFDAAALIAWKRDLVETAVSRVGLTPQYVGVNTGSGDGYAISGTALRLRLIPTDSTGRGKGRYLDDALPRILRNLSLIDTLPLGVGGFGRDWTDPTGLPTVERGDGLPPDPVEEAQTHASLVAAGLLSVETSLRERYPEWDDDRIAQELDRIRADGAARPSMLGGF